MDIPVFVVTGAPNKGKSTFLKAMTNDNNIEVGEIARTTTKSKPYHVKSGLEDEILMTLWDTPGFENAAEVYEILEDWKKENSNNSLELIKRYVETYKENQNHKYEVEILEPLTEFSAIIYIADCSKSFSEEVYLREIQLLQFTNLPRIAILNPIDGQHHLESWREGLRKYFHNIKVFNPHKTSFEEKLSTLGALSHLHDEWEKPINRIIEILKTDRESVLKEAARIIRSTVLKIYDKKFEIRFNPIDDEKEYERKLLSEVRKFVIKTMNQSQEKISARFGFDIEIELNKSYEDNDLFDETVRKQNITIYQRGIFGAVGGAALGLAVDVPAGGLAFGIPTATGAVIGFGAGCLSGIKMDDLINYKNPFRSDEKMVLQIKSLDIELGFLIINRLRQVVINLYNRTAANNEKIIISKDLDKGSLLKISKLLGQISKSKKHRYSETKKKKLLDFIYNKLIEDQKA